MYRLLLIDNYDSFTYNLFQMFLELGLDIHVHRNDRVTVEEIGRLEPRWILKLFDGGYAGEPCRRYQRWISSGIARQVADGTVWRPMTLGGTHPRQSI